MKWFFILIISMFLFSACSKDAGSSVDALVGSDLNPNNPDFKPLIFDAIQNQIVPAVSSIAEVQPQVTDPNGLTLTFSCVYDELIDGSVGSAGTSCSSLQDAVTTTARFNTTSGVFGWTPTIAYANKNLEFKISVTDGSVSAYKIFSIRVTPPAPSTLTSVLTLSSATVASGSTIVATLQGKDQLGTNLNYGGATIVFRNSGGLSTGSWSATTDNGDGTYSAVFTGTTSGSATTVSATIQGSSLATTLPTLSVSPGPISPARSLVSVSNASVSAGFSVTLSLQAKDAAGNSLVTGGAAILFNRSSGTSVGTFSAVTDNSNGTYSATFTGVSAGTPAVMGGTVNGVAISTPLPSVQVVPGTAIASLSTLAVSSSTVVSGQSVTVTLQAKDNYGNNLTSGGLSVAFSNSGGASTGTFSSVQDNGNGTYTSNFTGLISGSATTIGATVSAVAVTTTLPTVQVLTGPASAAKSILTVSSVSVASGSSVTLTLTARDLNDNLATVGGSTIVFSQSGGTSTGLISATTDNGNGTYTATFTGQVAGTARTINATVAGSALQTALPTVTVIPGAISVSQSYVQVSAATVQSGSSINLTLRARDNSGNILPAGGSAISFTRSGGTSTGNLSVATDNLDGTYSGTFSGVTAGTATSISATIGGVPLSSVAPTVTVTVGTISLAQSSVSVSAGTVASGSSVTLTLQAKDSNGNNLNTGGEIVGFTNSGGTSTGTISATVDNGDGTYRATFTGQASGTPTAILGTITGAPVSTAQPNVQVTPGPASLANSVLTTASPTVNSSSAVTLTLQTKDAYGNNITSGGLVITLNYIGGTSTGTFSSVTDYLNGSYAVNFVGVTSGTPTQIRASIGGSALTSLAPSVQVLPGLISTAKSVITVSSSTVTSGSTLTLTLQAKDANDNFITTGGATVLFSNSSGTSSGTYSAVSDQSNGTYTAIFTGTTSGSATNIGATIGGSPVTLTPSPQITVTPGTPTALTFTTQPTLSTTPANPLPTQPIVSISDANGNTVTSGPNSTAQIAITLTTLSGSGVLGGTATLNAASGVANFTGRGLNISSTGNYKLTATASSLSLTQDSSVITITATTPVISVTNPLTISYLTTSTPSVYTSAISVVTGTGTPVTGVGAAPGYTGPHTISTPTGPTNTPAIAKFSADTSGIFTVNVTGTNTNSCTIVGPLSAASCNTSGFNLSFLDIKNANTSVVSGTDYIKINDGYVNSNQLTVKKYLIDQVTNTAGNAASDLVGSPAASTDQMGTLFNGKYYFPGITATGKSKLFSLNSSGDITQVTDITGSGFNDVPGRLIVFNGSLYFNASNASRSQTAVLYRLTTGGTLTQLSTTSSCNIAGNGQKSAAVMPSPLRLYFAHNIGGVCKLVYIDTSDNIVQVSNVAGAATSDGVTSLIYFNNYIWFGGNCTTTGYAGCPSATAMGRWFRVDSAGTINDIKSGSAAESGNYNLSGGYSTGVGNPVIFNNKLYGVSGKSQAYLSVDTSDVFTSIVARGSFSCPATPPVIFNGNLYLVGINSLGYCKLLKITPAGVATVAANVSGYDNIDDFPNGASTLPGIILGVLSQGGVDQELYFMGYAKGLFSKLFKLDTSGNVTQMSDLVPGGYDIFFREGFMLPSGPGGINEFYFGATIGTPAANYFKIFKIHPQYN